MVVNKVCKVCSADQTLKKGAERYCGLVGNCEQVWHQELVALEESYYQTPGALGCVTRCYTVITS